LWFNVIQKIISFLCFVTIHGLKCVLSYRKVHRPLRTVFYSAFSGWNILQASIVSIWSMVQLNSEVILLLLSLDEEIRVLKPKREKTYHNCIWTNLPHYAQEYFFYKLHQLSVPIQLELLYLLLLWMEFSYY
jgi:hypothetical protein